MNNIVKSKNNISNQFSLSELFSELSLFLDFPFLLPALFSMISPEKQIVDGLEEHTMQEFMHRVHWLRIYQICVTWKIEGWMKLFTSSVTVLTH